MSSILRKDKIGNLSHSAGNILLAPSILTIGGRQYETTSTLSVALPTMTANTRYQVYAVQTAGVVSLVISQNENSVGPAGYSSWKLVGCLYSNGLGPVGFGSFVNIKGRPISEVWNLGALTISATTTAPTKASSGIVVDQVLGSRDGEKFKFHMYYEQNGITGANSGSGDYLFGIKIGSVDTNKIRISAEEIGPGSQDFTGGFGTVTTFHPNTDSGDGYMKMYNATQFRVYADANATANNPPVRSIHYALANVAAGVGYSFEGEVPIQGWSNTPIEDL